VIIHNASFDLGFLDAEFSRIGFAPFATHVHSVIDTLLQAREMHPGKRNSLDALCDRYGVSNAHRTLHGALLDAELLAEVYLGMTRGQNSLMMDAVEEEKGVDIDGNTLILPLADVILLAASEAELAEHNALLDKLDKEIKGSAIWRRVSPAATAA
jgi:DNA polymerase-3 subunit epsilon